MECTAAGGLNLYERRIAGFCRLAKFFHPKEVKKSAVKSKILTPTRFLWNNYQVVNIWWNGRRDRAQPRVKRPHELTQKKGES